MVSSAYIRNPRANVQVDTITVASGDFGGGSGYSVSDPLIIQAPNNIGTPGITAAGVVATIGNNGITSFKTLFGGSGYTVGETVTLSAGGGTGAKATVIVSSGGVVTNIFLTDSGTGFAVDDILTITGDTSAALNATITVATIADGVIRTITVNTNGIGYSSPPKVTVVTTGVEAKLVANLIANFGINENMFTEPLVITKEDLRNGGAGILRCYLSFTAGTPAPQIQAFNHNAVKGFLNADMSMELQSLGFYHFDLDAEGEDEINLKQVAGTTITGVNLIRIHLVPFGA